MNSLPTVENSPPSVENSPPPVGSTDPQKMDVASSAAASPPGKPRGSDGPIGDACMYKATLGTSMLGEILGPRTSRTEQDLRGRDSRSLDGNTASAPGGTLGRCTPTLTVNPRGTDGPSGGELSPEDLLSRSQNSPRQDSFSSRDPTRLR